MSGKRESEETMCLLIKEDEKVELEYPREVSSWVKDFLRWGKSLFLFGFTGDEDYPLMVI